jgi:outer membrane protein OmpA-like peptidoglycan-associated protein
VANNAEAAGTQPAAEKPSASDAAAASKQQLAAATPRASGDHTPRRPSAPEASNKQASDLQQVSPHGSVVTLTDDLFHAGAPYLRPGATRSIDPLAEFLRANPKRKLRIAGFAQSPEQALSKGRADEVREALMRRGVAADRIQAVGLAKSDARQTPYVEIVISDERGNITAR